MDFYNHIATYYNDIFPLNENQITFIKRSVPEYPDIRLLDIGSATGNLTLKLAEDINDVTGIDLDENMVAIARKRAEKEGKNIQHEVLNMLNTAHFFKDKKFDVVTCFGNTLVHLPDTEVIREFLKQTFDILKPNGHFLFQILNYNFILRERLPSLPLIDNDRVRFERHYLYSDTSPQITFKTLLTIKEDDVVQENKVRLFPITLDQIKILLKEEGFSIEGIYGNFNGGTLEPKSLPLVVHATKA